ncbi:MFS transporter [Pseudonocardia xishanensis]|uniref:MHS family MFS transporter n=1 Tax=Pseudonocardia xishanensis TaxID=630995 RepID=A0ABP8S1V7_9PSEU
MTDARMRRKVIAAGFFGTAIEYYDFFIYGTAAALVFPTVFFPSLGGAAATAASFATFAVAFVARPIGGVAFGYIGDRIGRKGTLLSTLFIMGGATVLIGALPSGESIGALAPILLILLRFCQGLAIGGEWSSAALFVGEHAPKGRRGVYGLSPTLGASAGLLIANLAFLLIGGGLSSEAFLAWGWRVPFLLSAVLVVVGLWIRLGIVESPVFVAAAERAKQEQRRRAPLAETLRRQPRELVLGAGSTLMWLSFFYIGAVYLVNYGTTTLGFSRNSMLAVSFVGILFNAAGGLLGGWLSDRIGRRRMLGSANLVAIGWAFVLMPLASSGSLTLMACAIAGTQILVGIGSGTTTALLPELFHTSYRATATGVSFNLGSVVGGALPPIVAAPLIATHGPIALSVLMACLAAVAFGSIVALRETRGRSLDDHEPDPVPTTHRIEDTA